MLLVCSLVEVHSQTFPYVSFMGQTLANHSYVDLSLVGYDGSGSDSVQCHTDLAYCCNENQGSHRGDWYFPNGDRLPFFDDIFERREAQRVDIRRWNSHATSPVGIYRCDIPTAAVNNDTDRSVRDAPVYVGLYTDSGGKFPALLRKKTGYKQFKVGVSCFFCRKYLEICCISPTLSTILDLCLRH